MSELSNVQNKVDSTGSTPEVPIEVWNMIFGFFEGCTLNLKSFRLVCRHWARLAAQSLFSVAYLDAYNTSWSKLRRLCLSRYATCVKTISWSPLVLYGDCLDFEVWCYSCPNILKDVDDTISWQLHRSFCYAYNTSAEQASLEASDIRSLLQVLPRLRNCHNVVICDDMDPESRCADGLNARMLQSNMSLWETTSTWARIPRFPAENSSMYETSQYQRPAELERSRAMWTVLELFNGLDNLPRLRIDLREITFTDIFCAEAPPIKQLLFENLHINLKSYRRRMHYGQDDSVFGISPRFDNVYIESFLRLFVDLQELCIGAADTRPATSFDDTFNDSRPELNHTTDSNVNDDDNSPQQDQSAIHSSDLGQPYNFHQLANIPPAVGSIERAI